MLDACNNKVHLMYLHLLVDFQVARLYSLGLALLATLYHEFCRATKNDTQDTSWCLVLLQSWALYEMSETICFPTCK